MNKNGPIIIIEDDMDDQDILTEIFKSLAYINQVMFFPNGHDALTYLTGSNVRPFLILSDINLPKLNGIELRDKLHNNESLRSRCIPYLFLTTSGSYKSIIDAYSKSAQGFFVKPLSFDKLKTMIVKIVDYWKECMAPNYIE